MEEYFSVDRLRLAWERYIREGNRGIKDLAGINLFGQDLEENLDNLSELLASGNFHPSRPAKYFQPKLNGTLRTITILNVYDALVYQCMVDTIAERAFNELQFYDEIVFGSVLNKEVNKGVTLLEEESAKFFFFEFWPEKYKQFASRVNNEIDDSTITHKLVTDITGFFDCIIHSKLLTMIYTKYGIDKSVLNLLSNCLNTWSGTEGYKTLGIGIPQGPQASSFLGNLFLFDLDNILIKKGLKYFRYMDDYRIYSTKKIELIWVLIEIDKFLKSRGLILNSNKTLIEPLSENKEEEKLEIEDLIGYLGDFQDAEGLIQDEFEDVDLHEQFGHDSYSEEQLIFNIGFKSIEEVAAFIQDELKEIKDVINSEIEITPFGAYFKEEKSIDVNLKKHQKKWTKLGKRYRDICDFSKQMNLHFTPDEDLIDVWFLLADTFLAKTDQFHWILRKYPRIDSLKKKLKHRVEASSLYEWIQFQNISTLYLTQHLTLKELRYYFKKLNNAKTFYLKYGLYLLLIDQTNTEDQLYRFIIKSLQEEKDTFLKSWIGYQIELKSQGQLSKMEIAKKIGLI